MISLPSCASRLTKDRNEDNALLNQIHLPMLSIPRVSRVCIALWQTVAGKNDVIAAEVNVLLFVQSGKHNR
jgi:hypothetical protein